MTITYDQLFDLDYPDSAAWGNFTSGNPTGFTNIIGYQFDRPLRMVGLAFKRPVGTSAGAVDIRARMYDNTGVLLASSAIALGTSSSTLIGTPSEVIAGTFSAVPFDTSVIIPANLPIWFGFWSTPSGGSIPIYGSLNSTIGATIRNPRDGVVATCHSTDRGAASDTFPTSGSSFAVAAVPVYQYAGADSVGILTG